MAHNAKLSHTAMRGPSARCEGCGLAFVVDLLDAVNGEDAGNCPDCGSPLYVIDAADDLVDLIENCPSCAIEAGGVCVWHDGFGAGWDACVAAVAGAVGAEREAELVGLDLSGLVDGVVA